MYTFIPTKLYKKINSGIYKDLKCVGVVVIVGGGSRSMELPRVVSK